MATANPSDAQKSRQPHTHSEKLEDQAATAALYATGGKGKEKQAKTGHEYLDEDNKLSSAGAAASLKYANPQSLPSFPSVGLKNNTSAAGAAASLGWSNQKPYEPWKPEASSSAFTAATLANDYKLAPAWQPEASKSGAKAAVLAHKDDKEVEVWKPEVNNWGNSAANLAFKKNLAGGLTPQPDSGNTALGRKGSLMAATGAMSGRRRAGSTPIAPKPETYPDEANASSNALNAATSATARNRNTASPQGGSVLYTSMSAAMYTSHPPVEPEVQEQKREKVLHASAIAMAKVMYNRVEQNKATETDAQRGAASAHARSSSLSTSSDDIEPMRFNNIQEAAQKLAQERLAKLYDDSSKNREYRDYYGTPAPLAKKLTLRGRPRRRASSLDADRAQSNKIRAQMSMFNSNLSQVDEKKRKSDREALIAAAQRNVNKQLHGMDEKVFKETGHVAPSLLEEWEIKAHAAAQAKSETRMENYGKVNIGGGKFIDQSAVDAVAAKNVQPVLDEINEKAEGNREKQATMKMEQEANARKVADQKAREKESKAINKKLAQQDKEEEKMRKADEKAALEEERRLTKEKRKPGRKSFSLPFHHSTESKPKDEAVEKTEEPSAAEPASPVIAAPAVAEQSSSPITQEPPAEKPAKEALTPEMPSRTSMEDQASLRMRETAAAANEGTPIPLSPTTAEGGKVKFWLKAHLSRHKSQKSTDSTNSNKDKYDSFVGGATLTGAGTEKKAEKKIRQPGKIAGHPLTGRLEAEEAKISEDERPGRGRRSTRDRDVSPVSAADESEFQEARDEFDEDLAPPPTFPAEKSSSPARDSKFRESLEEM